MFMVFNKYTLHILSVVIRYVVYWIIRREGTVQTPGQTFLEKRNSVNSSQEISGKNSMSKLKFPWKSLSIYVNVCGRYHIRFLIVKKTNFMCSR